MKSYIMEVSKKENGAYVKQGEVEIFYPLLNELGLVVEADKEDEDGFPIYSDEKVQYVFDAVLAAVKAQARNRLVSGTATLKPGQSIADSVEALLESGGNKGDALAAVREFHAALRAWLPSCGKSEKVQQTVYKYLTNKAGLSLHNAETKTKLGNYLIQFAESLDEVATARFSRPMLAIQEALDAEDSLDD